MRGLWERLAAQAKARGGQSLGLRPGTSEEAIAAAESVMQQKLPADFRASLLLHDGQEGDETELFRWMPGCSPLASLEAIVEQWKYERNHDQPLDDDAPAIEEGMIQSVAFHPKRLPIAGTPDWDGDTTYLDLFPGPEGTEGQLITLVSECDLVVLGSSFSGALRCYVEALESGVWEGGVTGNEADRFAAHAKKVGATKAARPVG